MQERIIKYRLLIIIAFSLITLSSLLLFPKLKVNPDLDDYVPDKMENKVYMQTIDSIFGGGEMILVMLQTDDALNSTTLNRLRNLADSIALLDEIDNVISPFEARNISNDDGFMVMEPLFDNLSQDISKDSLKQLIANNSLASSLFSEDFTMVSIILTKVSGTTDIVIEDILDFVNKIPGDEEVHIGGLPFIRYSISGNIKDDMVYLLPLALVLMVFMLRFSFREWRGVFLPFIIVIMSIALSFGVMALLGWEISLLTILMPIMLIAIANDYGIHMIARYQELSRSDPEKDMKAICKQIYRDLKKPILVTGLTTIGGVLGLLTHTMVPAAQLGVLIAIGIAFALLLSIWFLPALLSYFKLPDKKYTSLVDNKTAPADRWLNRFSRWVSMHPKRIVWISVAFGVIGTLGILFIKVDTNIEGYFLGKSEVRISTELINENFGGSQFVSVMFKGDVLAPDLLKRMETYEQTLINHPVVGRISSPVTLFKELSKGFYSPGESGYNNLPQTADEAYQFLEIFSMGDNTSMMERFIDYNYENSRMLISLKDGSNSAGKELYAYLKELTKNDPAVSIIAGACLTKIELADMVVNGQIKSLLFAMLVVFVLLSSIFKSYKAGLLSSLPLSIAILVLFGIMGFLGIALDIATALLSSIMIGVGVDYTIHFIWRFKEERARGMNHKEATKVTFSTTGRGIIFNAISVIIGFLSLSLSNFAPLRYFSLLIVISISTCLIAALLLIPAIIILVKPNFLEKRKTKS